SVGVPTTVTGGAGDDAVSIGAGSLKNNFAANVEINGGAGNDQLNLLGQNDSGTNSYTFSSVTQFRFGDTTTGKTVTFSGIEQATLQCGDGNDTIDVSAASIALSIFANAGNDNVSVTNSTLPVTVNTGSENPGVIFGSRLGDG